eukprot:scaffold101503_cov13-Tisochrysis_lutea.AAC.1
MGFLRGSPGRMAPQPLQKSGNTVQCEHTGVLLFCIPSHFFNVCSEAPEDGLEAHKVVPSPCLQPVHS